MADRIRHRETFPGVLPRFSVCMGDTQWSCYLKNALLICGYFNQRHLNFMLPKAYLIWALPLFLRQKLCTLSDFIAIKKNANTEYASIPVPRCRLTVQLCPFVNLYTTAVEMQTASALRQAALVAEEGIPHSQLPQRFPRQLDLKHISTLRS